MLSAKGQADPRDRRTRQEVPFAGNAAFSPRGAGVGSCTPASSAASQAPPQMGLSAGDGPRCSEQLPEPCGCCQGRERYVKRGSVSFLWERADNTGDTITFTVPTCGSTPVLKRTVWIQRSRNQHTETLRELLNRAAAKSLHFLPAFSLFTAAHR